MRFAGVMMIIVGESLSSYHDCKSLTYTPGALMS